MEYNKEVNKVLSEVDSIDIIPESCLSFSEMNDYIVEDTMSRFNEMIKSIGINELVYFESTGALLEYTNSNTIQNQLTNFSITNWQVRKAFYDKAIEYVKEQRTTIKKCTNIKKVDNNNIGNEDPFGKTHLFFDLSDINFADNSDKFIDECIKVVKGLFDSSTEDERKEAINMLEESICSRISGISNVKTIKEMKKSLKEKLIGDEVIVNGKYVKSNWENITNIAYDASFKVIKKAYNDEKKAINSNIKKINIDLKHEEDYAITVASLMVNAFSAMQTCYSVMIDVAKRRVQENNNIINKVCKTVK